MDALTYIFSHVCGQGRPFVLDGEALPVCQRCLGLYAGAALTGLWILASGLWRRALPERSAAYAHIVMLLAAMAGGVHWLDAGPTWRLVCGLWTGHVAMLWLVGGAGHFLRLAGCNVLVLRRPLLGFRAAGLLTRRAEARRRPAGRGGSGGPVAEFASRACRPGQRPGSDAGPNPPPPKPGRCPGLHDWATGPGDPPPQAFDDPPWPRGLRIQALAAGPVLAAAGWAFTHFVSTGWHAAAALAGVGAAFLALALVRAIIGVAWWAVSSFLLHAPEGRTDL